MNPIVIQFRAQKKIQSPIHDSGIIQTSFKKRVQLKMLNIKFSSINVIVFFECGTVLGIIQRYVFVIYQESFTYNP